MRLLFWISVFFHRYKLQHFSLEIISVNFDANFSQLLKLIEKFLFSIREMKRKAKETKTEKEDQRKTEAREEENRKHLE